MNTPWTERIVGRLADVRARRPLVHNITNYVVMNTTANALLALGASPVMAHAEEEVEEMAGMAGALVLNIGTLSSRWIDAMFRAAGAARQKQVPIVLDPVGAGATRLRTETARRLLSECRPSVVRGNASEILALGGSKARARGVDSLHTVDEARHVAQELAGQFALTVAVTGPEDFVTDGARAARVRNGHPLMSRLTGTGCAATAIIGAFCAVEPEGFAAALAGLVVFGIAGELAARGRPRPGTYQVQLLDALDEVNADHVRAMAQLSVTPDPGGMDHHRDTEETEEHREEGSALGT
jgi:hydroxyethylthiazole kinase